MFLSALGTVSGQDFCILFRIQNDRFVVYITINHQPSTINHQPITQTIFQYMALRSPK